MRSPSSVGRTLLILFRWGIFLLACAFLWKHLAADKGRQALDAVRSLLATPSTSGVLVLVGVLMVVNWWIESVKWRRVVAPVERVGAWRAFMATIAGTSVALITPNRTGEFLGRVLFLDPTHRVQGAFATALAGISQFVVTLVAGGLALLVMTGSALPLPWPPGWVSTLLVSLTALVTTGALVLYLRPGLLKQLILLVPILKRLERAASILDRYSAADLRHVLLLSFLRYAVFAFQFVLLLQAFDGGVGPWQALLAVAVIYLISTLIPTVMLTELGVRGSAAVALMQPLGGAEVPVLLASTILWVVNLVIPALVGSIILLVARIRTSSHAA